MEGGAEGGQKLCGRGKVGDHPGDGDGGREVGGEGLRCKVGGR